MLPAYADIHVKWAIVTGLQRRGMDAVRAQDRGMCGQDDESLLADATSEGRLLLTTDRDFLVLDSAWQAAGKIHAGIVFWRQNQLSIGEVIRRTIVYAVQTAPTNAANIVHYL